MWYKGLGEISIVNVRSWDEIRIIENISGKAIFQNLEELVLRKLITTGDFSKIITLNLHDKTTTNEVYLTIADLDKKKKAFSEEYTNLVGKGKS